MPDIYSAMETSCEWMNEIFTHSTMSATWVINAEMVDTSRTVVGAADSCAGSSDFVSGTGAEFEYSLIATLDVRSRFQIEQKGNIDTKK